MSKLKIAIITQDDRVAIPRNIALLVDHDLFDVATCILIDSRSSLSHKKWLFVRGFGVLASLKMFVAILQLVVLDFSYRVTGAKALRDYRSIRTLCRESGVELRVTKDINSDLDLERIESLSPDIVVSYSAPVVFRQRLLDLPKFGCINLHCSLIPNFCGVLPSFWSLKYKAEITGCSVHKMDDKIDNGDLLAQQAVAIDQDETMHSLVKRTKHIGGKLTLQVLVELSEKGQLPHALQVDERDRKYYSWPTVTDLREFRAEGGRLI